MNEPEKRVQRNETEITTSNVVNVNESYRSFLILLAIIYKELFYTHINNEFRDVHVFVSLEFG